MAASKTRAKGMKSRDVEKLKKEDRFIKELRPEKEKKVFEKGESYLKRLIKPSPIEIDLKKLSKERKKYLDSGRAKGK
jgi:hypothetical protein